MHGVHNGSSMDGLERRNRKDTLIATIDAYLAAPSESAMEVVDELEKLLNMDQAVFPPKDSYEKAAALIEGLQRRVPIKYMRFGKPPESGHSINHIDPQNPKEEPGVSVYPAIEYNGDLMPILPAYNHYAAVDMEWCMDRPRYEIWGKEIGLGSDGEPLLIVEKYQELESKHGVAIEEV